MLSTALKAFRHAGRLLPLAPLLLLTPAAQAQQVVSPTAGLPTITAVFNHTSTVAKTGYEFNYYDFTITGFQKVTPGDTNYDIYSFGNSTLEKQTGVFGVLESYLPTGWTFDDSNDFTISVSSRSIIHADDPQFGLIFIQNQGTTPIDPLGAPFTVFHQTGGKDPFVGQNGKPIIIPVSAPMPESSTTASLGLLLLLGLGGMVVTARKRGGAQKGQTSTL